MLWRILKPLSDGKTRIEPGGIQPLNISEKHLKVLQERGAIAPVFAPPLTILTGWEKRAIILAKQGIVAADQFLEAHPEQLAKWLKESPEKIAALRHEVEAHLLPNPRPTIR